MPRHATTPVVAVYRVEGRGWCWEVIDPARDHEGQYAGVGLHASAKDARESARAYLTAALESLEARDA